MASIIAWILANWQIVGAIIAALFGIPMAMGKNPLAALSWAGNALGVTTPDVDDDAADMQAFRRLEARFVRTKCKEGADALKIVATHFLHSEGA